jgi:hypothetical protein
MIFEKGIDCVPSPKQPTKTTSATTQAELTHTHQRLRVRVRLEAVAASNVASVDFKGSNESDAGGGLSDGASIVGFTNDFPEEYGLV